MNVAGLVSEPGHTSHIEAAPLKTVSAPGLRATWSSGPRTEWVRLPTSRAGLAVRLCCGPPGSISPLHGGRGLGADTHERTLGVITGRRERCLRSAFNTPVVAPSLPASPRSPGAWPPVSLPPHHQGCSLPPPPQAPCPQGAGWGTEFCIRNSLSFITFVNGSDLGGLIFNCKFPHDHKKYTYSDHKNGKAPVSHLSAELS